MNKSLDLSRSLALHPYLHAPKRSHVWVAHREKPYALPGIKYEGKIGAVLLASQRASFFTGWVFNG
jgi:hypothetical protein